MYANISIYIMCSVVICKVILICKAFVLGDLSMPRTFVCGMGDGGSITSYTFLCQKEGISLCVINY